MWIDARHYMLVVNYRRVLSTHPSCCQLDTEHIHVKNMSCIHGECHFYGGNDCIGCKISLFHPDGITCLVFFQN